VGSPQLHDKEQQSRYNNNNNNNNNSIFYYICAGTTAIGPIIETVQKQKKNTQITNN
jgi:hypothetical protein